MELIQGIIQPPKVQSVEDTIPILCDRLENSTLISDRRSAVLGLKSFSREYREAVIASGLKPLIAKLVNDRDDEDLVKAVLETLLILFIRGEGTDDLTRNWISQQSRLQNGKYPSPLVMKQEKEPVDQFSLWITDALTQKEDLIKLFFTFLDRNNFHVRLYTIQLLEAMIATRPHRAKELIIGVPTAVSTLVKLLDDINEPIRDESILLLMAVVNDNSHIQKLVAFENIFETLFSIIDDEGGLRGSLVVNDCFSLINNILKYNTSNQTLFYETGNLQYLSKLLNEPLCGAEEFFWNAQRESNLSTLLDIIRLTVEDGNTVTKLHQLSLHKSNILFLVLRLAFFSSTPNSIRPAALLAAADIIRNNPDVQDQFAKIDVPLFDPNISAKVLLGNPEPISVITVLLYWTLKLNSIHAFDIRIASLELLKASFSNNKNASQSFLKSQKGHYLKSELQIEGEADILTTNIFDAIFNYDPNLSLNPYRLFLSTELLMFFIRQDADEGDMRTMLREINSGFRETEEEVLSAIQSVGELVVTSLSSKDIRIPISFLCFLIFWLYEDKESVSDFLSNKSLINSLLTFSSQVQNDTSVRCLVTMLLGIAYEFSSTDSAISRENLFSLIVKCIGVDNYASKIKQLRESELFKAAPVSYFSPLFDETGLPKIYFSVFFIDLFTENFYRIQTSLRRDPKDEPEVKITYEVYDEISCELSNLRKDLQTLQISSADEVNSMTKEICKLKDKLASLSERNTKMKEEYEELKKSYINLEHAFKDDEVKLANLQTEKNELVVLKEQNMAELEVKRKESEEITSKIVQLTKKLEDSTKEKKNAEAGINKMSRELFSLTKESDGLREQLKSLSKDSETNKKDYEKKIKEFESILSANEKEASLLREKIHALKQTTESLEDAKNRSDSDLLELQTKFNSHEALIPKLTDKLKSLAADYKEIEIEKNHLKSRLDEEKASHSKVAEKIHAELAVITTERNKLRDNVADLTVKFQQSNEQIARQSKEFHEKIEKNTSKLHDVESLLSAAEANCNEFAKTKELLLSKLEEERKRCAKIETTLKAATGENGELKSKVDNLQDSIIAINEELQTVLDDKANLLKEISQLEGQNKDFEYELEKAKSENQTLKEKSKELQQITSKHKEENEDIVNNYEHKISTLSAEIKTLTERIKEIEQEDEKYRSACLEEKNSLSEKLQCVSIELKDKNDKYALIESSFAVAQTEIKDLRDQVLEKEKLLAKINIKSEEGFEQIKSLSRKLENDRETQRSVNLKLSDTEKELAILKDENSSLSSELAERINESTKFAKAKSDLEKDLKLALQSASEEKSKLETSITALKSELSDRLEEFEKERELLTQDSSSQIKEYSKKISHLEENLGNLRAELEQSTIEYENAKSLLGKKLKEVSHTCEEKSFEGKKLSEKLTKLAKDFSEKDSECITLQDKVSIISKKLENSESEFKKLLQEKEIEAKSLKAALNETKGIKDEIEISLKELQKKFETQTDVLSKKDIEMNSILQEDETKTKDLELLKSELETIESQLEIEKKLKNSQESNLEEAKAKIVELETEIGRLTPEVNSRIEEIMLLKTELAQQQDSTSGLERKKHELSDKVSKLQRENDTLCSTLSELKVAHMTMEEAKNSSELSYKDDVQNLRRTNAELLEETTRLSSELSASKLKNDNRSEIDDLMILVTDLDEKNSKYKSKLLQLGVELSSDEEEDSEMDTDEEI